MQILPIKMPLIRSKDDLIEVILTAIEMQNLQLQENDIIALSSKIVSYAQGRLAEMSKVKPSKKARLLAKQYALIPAFAELVLREADSIVGGVPKAVLTLNDDIYTVNAGIDQKNAPEGYVVLWPKNPQRQAEHIREKILQRTKRRVGVLIIDSGIAPGRWGTRGLAIGVAGFEPVKDYRKACDLFGKNIMMTLHSVGDDLASAAHSVMGESIERTPVVIIREPPATFTENVDAEMMKIPPKNDAYIIPLKPKHCPLPRER